MANKELRALSSVSNNVLLPTVLCDGRCSGSRALLAFSKLVPAPSWDRSALGQVSAWFWLVWNAAPTPPVMESFRGQLFNDSLPCAAQTCAQSWCFKGFKSVSSQQSGTTLTKLKEVWIHPTFIFTYYPLHTQPFPRPLYPSVSDLAVPQPRLAGDEGEAAFSECSCASDGEPQSELLHPDTYGAHELHPQGSHLLSPQSHLYPCTLGYLSPNCTGSHSKTHFGLGEEQLYHQHWEMDLWKL